MAGVSFKSLINKVWQISLFLIVKIIQLLLVVKLARGFLLVQHWATLATRRRLLANHCVPRFLMELLPNQLGQQLLIASSWSWSRCFSR